MGQRSLLVVAALLASSGSAWAERPSPIRAAVAERRALRRVWSEALRQTAPAVGDAVVYHQVTDPHHRQHWTHRLAQEPLPSVLKDWIPRGRYPGIWTLKDPAGWYGNDLGGQPFRIRLKPGMILFDPDDPKHQEVYAAWKKNDLVLRGPQAENRFAQLPASGGWPLSTKAAWVRAPSEERFYRELGIAGVAHYDTYGRECLVLLNPGAIAAVEAPH